MLENSILLNHTKSLVSNLLDDVEDLKFLPHLEKAKEDYKNITFESETSEKEAIGCKTLFYYTPVMWAENKNRIDESGFNPETTQDMETFQNYWLDRVEGNNGVNEVKKYLKIKNKKTFLFMV